MVLREYIDMTDLESDKYIIQDSINTVLFWKGHKTHHTCKLGVKMHDATLFHRRLLLAPPRARTGQFFCCHLNINLLLCEGIIVIWL